MKVTLGYVSLPITLDITSSSTITYTKFKNLNDGLIKIDELIIKNLKSLMEILKYNNQNNIHFYRISSNLIPLATLSEVEFDYIKPYIEVYRQIGDFIKKNNMRVDMHPDQFCVLNSSNPKVVDNSLNILKYHESLLNAFGLENSKLILHVGSNSFGKEKSLTRFRKNFNKLNNNLKKMIIIENDDKVFDAYDVLKLCKELNTPMVLDYHHHKCNPCSKDIKLYYKEIFDTWKNDIFPPKVHFSSPKSKLKKEFRSHSDYIDVNDFIFFLESIKEFTDEIYVMIEAKKKDEALFRLVRQLKYLTNYEFIDETSFNVK